MVLGIMQFGTTIPESTGFALLDRWVEAGGRWLDTANCYSYWSDPSRHGGQSETVLGRWLKANPGVRDRLGIATKVGCEPVSREVEPSGTEGLAPAAVDRALADSLTRLNTDHVDLYWAHRDDREAPQEATVGAFGRLAASGATGRWGYSNAALWRVERARGLAAAAGVTGPSALQLRYSYLQPRPFVRDHIHDHRFGWVDDQTLDYAESNPGTEVWAYTPQMAGAYDRSDRPINPAFDHPGSTRRLEVLDRVASDLGLARGQVVLAWMTGAPVPVTPIVGVSSLPQLEAAIAATTHPLPADSQQALDEPW
jgi:aryl-alcohol dehydrogenase-like predicted oxidoreductase